MACSTKRLIGTLPITGVLALSSPPRRLLDVPAWLAVLEPAARAIDPADGAEAAAAGRRLSAPVFLMLPRGDRVGRRAFYANSIGILVRPFRDPADRMGRRLPRRRWRPANWVAMAPALGRASPLVFSHAPGRAERPQRCLPAGAAVDRPAGPAFAAEPPLPPRCEQGETHAAIGSLPGLASATTTLCRSCFEVRSAAGRARPGSIHAPGETAPTICRSAGATSNSTCFARFRNDAWPGFEAAAPTLALEVAFYVDKPEEAVAVRTALRALGGLGLPWPRTRPPRWRPGTRRRCGLDSTPPG